MRTSTLFTALAIAASVSVLPAQQVVQLGGSDTRLSWNMPEAFVVGDDEVRAEEQFSRIAATAFDADDNLYVLDGDDGRVAVFDRSGRFVRQFGRRGEGPGEFRFPSHIAVTNDRHIVVLDRGNRALVVYTRSGEYLRNIPIDQSLGIGGRFLAAHPQGGVVFAVNPGLMRTAGTPQMDTSGVRVYWQRSLAEGSEPILLATVQEPHNPEPARVQRTGNATIVMRQAPPAFTPQIHFGLTGGGRLVFNRTADYELQVVDEPGRVTRTLVRPQKARPVAEADKEAERQRRLEAIQNSPGVTVSTFGAGAGRAPAVSSQQIRQTREEELKDLQFAPTVPVIQGLFSEPDGRLWVWRTAPAPGRPPVIDLVAPDGRYVGTIQGSGLPSSVSPRGLAAWVTMNELDVPLVVVRRVPRQ